jgi:regulator of protease activity HflC (stomatin/prohibitin superfamily)
MRTTTPRIATLGLVLGALSATAGCTHARTPEGHEGYIYHIPLVFGKAEYRETLRGPASTGVAWRLYVKNVDMRATSYKESFQLLTSDNLSVEFEATTRIRLRAGSVKQIIEDWGEEHWYDWNVKEPLRTIVRQEITRVNAVAIQVQTEMVKQAMFDRLLDKYKDTPIEILSVDIGNIKFPQRVIEAIELKIAKQQELERQEFVLAKTRKEAAIRVLEALKAAKQQRIISSTLDPLYVQRLAVQVYRQLASSDNKTVIMLPNSAEGTGLPLVLSSSKRKILSPADEKLLADMEERYMAIAGATRKAGEGGTTAPAPPSAPPPSAPPPLVAPPAGADAPLPEAAPAPAAP